MKEFIDEIRDFLLSGHNVNKYGDEYWVKVVRGLKILFEFKKNMGSKNALIGAYMEVRNEILVPGVHPFIEDLSDELLAILIGSYPMPDFWTSSLDDFRSHKSFKKYFDILDNSSPASG
jgi:hypothetical protein